MSEIISCCEQDYEVGKKELVFWCSLGCRVRYQSSKIARLQAENEDYKQAIQEQSSFAAQVINNLRGKLAELQLKIKEVEGSKQ